jgi:hypothetical protein
VTGNIFASDLNYTDSVLLAEEEKLSHSFGREFSRVKKTHGETQITCEDNIKMYFKSIRSEGADGIYQFRVATSRELLLTGR